MSCASFTQPLSAFCIPEWLIPICSALATAALQNSARTTHAERTPAARARGGPERAWLTLRDRQGLHRDRRECVLPVRVHALGLHLRHIFVRRGVVRNADARRAHAHARVRAKPEAWRELRDRRAHAPLASRAPSKCVARGRAGRRRPRLRPSTGTRPTAASARRVVIGHRTAHSNAAH
jgi:hypothetical protein